MPKLWETFLLLHNKIINAYLVGCHFEEGVEKQNLFYGHFCVLQKMGLGKFNVSEMTCKTIKFLYCECCVIHCSLPAAPLSLTRYEHAANRDYVAFNFYVAEDENAYFSKNYKPINNFTYATIKVGKQVIFGICKRAIDYLNAVMCYMRLIVGNKTLSRHKRMPKCLYSFSFYFGILVESESETC